MHKLEDSVLKQKGMKKGITEEIATRKRALNFYSLANILPDPDIVLKKQGKDIRIYKELLCDPHVFACTQSRKAGVLSLDWEINRGLDKDQNAEDIENLLKKLDIQKLMSDILDATQFGFQPLEIIWKRDKSGHIMPERVTAKPPEWFCFDDDNNLKFRTKENYYGEIVPNKKFLLAQNNPSYNNPYGERTLSRVFWNVTFKKGGLKFWVVFTEKYGMPHLIGKHPRGSTKEETTLQKKGWWGEQIVVDTEGVAEKVQLGSMYRLKTIYSVNMQTAYQTGRYKTQYENVDNRPYWEYVAVMDASTRPEHAMLNGLIYRYDDPFWQSFYPPNGWRCRCRVNALSDYNLQKKNRTVSSSAGTLSEELALVSKKSGEYKPVTVYTDPLTGKRVAPDVGWSHNPASGLIEGN